MSDIYTEIITVETTHTDLYDNLRPNALLQFFQQLGTNHSVILNIGRDYLVEKYHACWILARVWYRLSRPIHAGEVLKIDTWHRGDSGIIFYRDFDLFVGDEHVGEGVSSWVVADIESRKMLRPSAIDTIAGAKAPDRVKALQLKMIRDPKDKTPVYDRTVRYSDLDVNGHMNNTKYADLLLDALTPEELEGRFISELQLNYSRECKIGETLNVSRKMDESGCYIDGCCGDSERRFEARLQFSALV